MKRKIKVGCKIFFVTMTFLIGIFIGMEKAEAATNNSMQNAQTISVNGTQYSGTVSDSVEQRFYKFTLTQSGSITVNYKAYMYCSHYYIYDSNGEEIIVRKYNYWNSVTEMYSSIEEYDLTKGTYYYCVEKAYNGSFDFSINFTAAGESFSEINGGSDNLMGRANNISLNRQYKGQLASNDDKDFYKFNLPVDCKLRIDVKAYIYYSHYYIYDSNGFERFSNRYKYWNSVSKTMSDVMYVSLEKGSYYFCVERGSTGNYNFTLSMSTDAMKLNKDYIILSKGKTASLKAILTPATGEKVLWESKYPEIATVDSKGTVKAKKAGYTIITATVGDGIKAECKIYVKPDATKLTKVKVGKKYGKYRTVSFKWKNKKDVGGYQIYYAKSKKGKFKKLYETSYSTSISKDLKRKKTYYVKVRTYKYENDRTVYSSWSSVKKVKVK